MHKPSDTTLFGKSVEMKFKVSGKIQWFKGQNNYVWWTDREIRNLLPMWWWKTLCVSQRQRLKVYLITVIQCRHLSSHYILLLLITYLLALHQTLVHTFTSSVSGSIISRFIVVNDWVWNLLHPHLIIN